MHHRTLTIMLPLTILFSEPCLAQKAKVPPKAEQKEALDLIKQVFESDYGQLPRNRAELAAKLLEQAAKDSATSPGRYMLLREAENLSAAAGEPKLALKAIDELLKQYEINGLQLKAEAIIAAAKVARGADANRAIAEAGYPLIADATTEDNYDLAKQLGRIATAAARKAGAPELSKLVLAAQKDAEACHKVHTGLKDSRDALGKQPTDRTANAAVGEFNCLMKGNWEGGLPQLVLGNDQSLQLLAKRDIATGVKPSDRLATADAWWDYGVKQSGLKKRRAQERAGFWYQSALPLLIGLEKAKAESRLGTLPSPKQLAKDFSERSYPSGSPTPLPTAMSPDAEVAQWVASIGGSFMYRTGSGEIKNYQTDLPLGSEIEQIRLERNPKVTDADLARVLPLKHLYVIVLDGTNVGDPGVALLAQSTIVCANLSDTRVTDEGVRLLSGMRSLKSLRLINTRITDDGVRLLSGLRDLRILDIWNTKTTDASLTYLRQTPALVNLRLTRSSVSPEALKAFREARPNCVLTAD